MLDLRERYGVIPSVLVPYPGKFNDILSREGFEVFCNSFYMWVGGNRLRSKCKYVIKHLLNRLYYHKNIYRILKDKHFDIIHTNSTIQDTGSFIAQHFSLPHVWNLMEYGDHDYNVHYLMPHAYVRSRYSRSDAIIAISDAVREDFVNERKVCPAEKTRTIYLGLSIPNAYDKLYVHDGRVNFCITGGVSAGKNQIMAIKACAQLKTFTDKFTLHIVGSGNPGYIAGLNDLVKSYGLDGHVKFWGWRDDVNDILHNMDVGLMLSKREAFGRVTVEYMLNYMPVIGVDTGATPEIVVDGDTGCICPLNDADRLAELMHRFITNPELLHSMGNKGREHAINNFSLERNTDAIYSLYQEILSTR